MPRRSTRFRNGKPKTHGIVLGQAAAAAILGLARAADGSDTIPLDTDADYPQGTAPGEYRFTAGLPSLARRSGGNASAFRAERIAPSSVRVPPYDVTSKKYTADFNEIKSLGAKFAPARGRMSKPKLPTFGWKSSPLQWNRIARTVPASEVGLDAWEKARLFGLLNMALADAGHARPSTRRTTGDRSRRSSRRTPTGTPQRAAEPTWTPLLSTPPFPSHVSGHSTFSGAAATVLKRFFGTDHVMLRDLQPDAAGREHRATDPSPVCRALLAASRKRRTRTGSRASSSGSTSGRQSKMGIEHGGQIGNRAVNRYLRPEW